MKKVNNNKLNYFHNGYNEIKNDLNKNYEQLRIKYKYKELILKKKIDVRKNVALKIVGPDSAYHIYTIRKDNN